MNSAIKELWNDLDRVRTKDEAIAFRDRFNAFVNSDEAKNLSFTDEAELYTIGDVLGMTIYLFE